MNNLSSITQAKIVPPTRDYTRILGRWNVKTAGSFWASHWVAYQTVPPAGEPYTEVWFRDWNGGLTPSPFTFGRIIANAAFVPCGENGQPLIDPGKAKAAAAVMLSHGVMSEADARKYAGPD